MATYLISCRGNEIQILPNVIADREGQIEEILGGGERKKDGNSLQVLTGIKTRRGNPDDDLNIRTLLYSWGSEFQPKFCRTPGCQHKKTVWLRYRIPRNKSM